MNKTLIAIFSIVVLPLGLVVGVSAVDPATHNVSYSVLSDRTISVERIEGGSTDIDFGTIAKTGTFTNSDLQLKFTAENATGSPSVKITAKLDDDLADGVTLRVSPAAVSDSVTTTLPSATPSPITLSADSVGNGVGVITGASKADTGIINATSVLTYTLVTSGAQEGTSDTVQIIYTLSDN